MKSENQDKIEKKNSDEDNVIKGLVLKEMLKRIEERVDHDDDNFIRTLKNMINEDKDNQPEEKPKKR